jgi:hypothetical protein
MVERRVWRDHWRCLGPPSSLSHPRRFKRPRDRGAALLAVDRCRYSEKYQDDRYEYR